MRCFFLLLFLSLVANILQGQETLFQHQLFFEQQQQEFQYWLDKNELGTYLEATEIQITPNCLSLILQEKEIDCSEIGEYWLALRKNFAKNHPNKVLHEKLLNTWSMLTEVQIDSLEIIIRCGSKSGTFEAKIKGELDGRITLTENAIAKMGNGVQILEPEKLKSIYAGECRIDTISSSSARNLRIAIGDFISQWYSNKGTPILYNAKKNVLEDYYNEFTYEFTHLSNEITDDNYYEYHRIHVKVIQKEGDKIEIHWDFMGKYGTSAIFPPKNSDYKLMETYYPEQMKAYETRLFKHVIDHLLKH